MAMRGRGLVKIGPQAFDGRAWLGAQEIAKFGAGLIEEKRLGNCRGIIYCVTQMKKGRGRRVGARDGWSGVGTLVVAHGDG